MDRLLYKSASDNLATTTIENIFINEYMPEADGDFVKVYLYGLKNSQNPQLVPLSNSELAKLLNIEEETIIRAYVYWEKKGVVKIEKINEDFSIIFNSLSEIVVHETEIKTNIDLFPSKYRDCREFKQLITSAEKFLGGSVLTTNFLTAFVDWIEIYQFDYECILYLLEHVLTNIKAEEYTLNGKLNYLKKVAEDWFERDIHSISDAIFYVDSYKKNNKLLFRILRELGIRRNPIKFERDLVYKWKEEYNYDDSIILEGVSRTTVPKFSYLDSILTNWHQKGFTTLKEIKSEPKQTPTNKRKSSKKDLPISQERLEAIEDFEDNIFEAFRQKLNAVDM